MHRRATASNTIQSHSPWHSAVCEWLLYMLPCKLLETSCVWKGSADGQVSPWIVVEKTEAHLLSCALSTLYRIRTEGHDC